MQKNFTENIMELAQNFQINSNVSRTRCLLYGIEHKKVQLDTQ